MTLVSLDGRSFVILVIEKSHLLSLVKEFHSSANWFFVTLTIKRGRIESFQIRSTLEIMYIYTRYI